MIARGDLRQNRGLVPNKIRGLEALDGVPLDGPTFVRLTREVLEGIKAEPGGIDELRTRSTPRAKKLLEEVLPIAGYVKARNFSGAVSIRWLGGSQGHDAELVGLGPDGPDFIEVTTAQHPSEFLRRQHSARTGGSFAPEGIHKDPQTRETISDPVARDAAAARAMFVEQLSLAIDTKAKKVYPPRTALVVLLDGLDVQLNDEMENHAASLEGVRHPFRELWIVRRADFEAWRVGPQA